MGLRTIRKIVYVIICLIVAAYFVHFRSTGAALTPKPTLSKTFTDIADWEGFGDVNMAPSIIEALDLDDYLFRSYHKGVSTVSLYIGYYSTTRKIGAAHSPLVCFPGQGWEISIPRNIRVSTYAGDINLEELIVTKSLQQELLFYWYQSYDMTSNGTFWQKIHNFFSRFNSNPEDNAFVRVSVTVQNEDRDAAAETALKFIRDFYPLFLKYIIS